MMTGSLIPTVIGEFGSSSSGLPSIGQASMMEGQLNPLDMVQNGGESSHAAALRDDEMDSKSGSENPSGDEEQEGEPRKKRYHRHTQHQIQEMENFFKECPHPDDKQRKELSRELGLEPLQIKFWFQNKRTQLKMQHERHENMQLRTENERLRAENMRYTEALSGSTCPNCGGPPGALGEMSFDEQRLRVENARLKEEIERMAAIAAKYGAKPILNEVINSSQQLPAGGVVFGSVDPLRPIGGPINYQADKHGIFELAVMAMDELTRLAQIAEPLWALGIDGSTLVLNEEEYFRTFQRGFGLRPPAYRCEATRETVVVMMNRSSLVGILMDANHWGEVFAGIISKAVTLEVLSAGIGDFNGALQVMNAEFQVLSPLVPTRESNFVRYSKHLGDGIWAVVDVSVENLHPCPLVRCRRRPSGCLIQEMSNGYSKVTWIEHVEVEDKGVHNIYRPLVHSGLAFGAKRWVSTLFRHNERFANAIAPSLPHSNIGNEGKKSMLKLAERMVKSFCGGVSASTAHAWTTLSGSGADDVRVMTRKSVDEPGRPPGIVLCAATSFWLPVPPRTVFDFLRDDHCRSQWDILSNGGAIEQITYIPTGQELGNCVSLLRVNAVDGSQNNMIILQECYTDPTGSVMVYAPVDAVAMDMVLGGGDTDYVALLPSGFAILPDGPTGYGISGIYETGPGGSLVTVAFQILVDSLPSARLSLGSVATVNNLITCTVERIKAAVGGQNT